jgi:hypothetical protein
MREKRKACRVLMGKQEGKKPLGKSTSRWENNIKMDLKEIEWGCMDWIHPAKDRDHWQDLVNTVMNFWVP